MTGANIFVIYEDGQGNVTLSPRHGAGEFEPEHDTTANVTLLEGSGVSNGKMVANVLCSNCERWSGGTTDFTGSSGDWIHASLPGDPLDSTQVDAEIDQHQDHGSFTWDYTSAQGGTNVNPFLSRSNNGSVSTPPSTTTSGSGDSDSESTGSASDMLVEAHGSLAAIAFVVGFPIGTVLLRIPNMSIWVHAGVQIFSYLCFIAAAGLGIYIAKVQDQLMNHHPIIGIVLLAVLFFQPLFGVLHHQMFKRKQGRGVFSYLHIWEGRLAVLLGIINGGLGLQLAGDVGRWYTIVYGVFAGLMGLVFLGSVIYGEVKGQMKTRMSSDRERQETRQKS